jgi:hypothetical protein
MVHPAELFIRYYVLAHWDPNERLDKDGLNEELRSLGLKTVVDSYLEAVEDDISDTIPDDFTLDDEHEASMDYLRSSGILPMFLRTDAVEGAFRLLHDRRHRRQLDIAITGMNDNEEVQEAMMVRFPKFKASAEEIGWYRWFFWNTDRMGQEDWYAYLEDDPNLRALLAAHKYGRANALYSLGVHERMDRRWIISSITTTLFNMFNELDAAMAPGAEKAKAMTKVGAQVVRNLNSIKDGDSHIEEMKNLYDKIKLAQEANPKILAAVEIIKHDHLSYDERN